MRTVKRKGTVTSNTAGVLLKELRVECETVVRLIRQLEKGAGSARERDEILGELSAAILHLHSHTAGLDEVLCEME
jgi:hypothetical protein